MRADVLLINDHRVLRNLLSQLQQSKSSDVRHRRVLLDRLVRELDSHTHIEDELFYPAVQAISPLFAIAHAEHRQIDDQLAVVLRTDPASVEFGTEIQMLAATIEHHADEEEREMFPQAHALGDDELESLGQRMYRRRQRLRKSVVTKLRLRVKQQVLRRL